MGLDVEGKLAKFGFKMLGSEDEIILLIKDIIESGNQRYLKAIPYLIYTHDLDSNRIHMHLKKKRIFEEMINLTRKIFAEEKIEKKLPKYPKQPILLKLDYNEFLQEFQNQRRLEKSSSPLIDKQKTLAERRLEFSLSKIFTRKEKEIIKKILNEESLTKTEYEYYSRKTKKKLESIISLEDFAKTIYNKKTIKEIVMS